MYSVYVLPPRQGLCGYLYPIAACKDFVKTRVFLLHRNGTSHPSNLQQVLVTPPRNPSRRSRHIHSLTHSLSFLSGRFPKCILSALTCSLQPKRAAMIWVCSLHTRPVSSPYRMVCGTCIRSCGISAFIRNRTTLNTNNK